MRTIAAPALLALVLIAGATSCSDGSGDDTEPAGSSTSETSGAPTSEPTEATEPTEPTDESSTAPFPADTRPDDGGYGTGNGLGLVGVRTSGHAGYDRVVFDLDGTGTPGWRVSYWKRPVSDGSGEPIALEGTTYLQVILRGMGLSFDIGIEPFGDDTTRVPGTGTEGVTEIAPGGVFEGDQLAYIGLTGARRPFRAFVLADPARLVVDVVHE